ncbi:MAG: beta-galactosidase, partial [Phycisphaerales bacterium]|nr:beta-galactosidase [Phycisphaerales bacterium]
YAAKQAGLNTIETPVFWNLIESRPRSYNFKGDNDIRHFIELVAQAGMRCILRPGPYIGEGWDLGGLPTWVLNIPELKVRQPNQPFLEAVGKFFNALARQVKDLQASTAGGGPIILVQNESQWTCDEQLMATKYLGELGRYLREAGFTVPRSTPTIFGRVSRATSTDGPARARCLRRCANSVLFAPSSPSSSSTTAPSSLNGLVPRPKPRSIRTSSSVSSPRLLLAAGSLTLATLLRVRALASTPGRRSAAKTRGTPRRRTPVHCSTSMGDQPRCSAQLAD